MEQTGRITREGWQAMCRAAKAEETKAKLIGALAESVVSRLSAVMDDKGREYLVFDQVKRRETNAPGIGKEGRPGRKNQSQPPQEPRDGRIARGGMKPQTRRMRE